MPISRVLLVSLFVTLCAPALAQGTQVAFGGLRQDPDAPVEVTSDTLSVSQTDGTAIFSGNVIVGQGNMRLSAGKVEVVYRDGGDGIEKLQASGGVTLVSEQDAAEADKADYDIKEGIIVMTGNVLLTQGPSALSAQRMTVDIDAGTAHMSGRVKTVLKSGKN